MAYRLGGGRSIQLSYEGLNAICELRAQQARDPINRNAVAYAPEGERVFHGHAIRPVQ